MRAAHSKTKVCQMHSDSYMPCSLIDEYKRKISDGPQSVQSTLFHSMKVSLVICLTIVSIVFSEKEPYIIPYNYDEFWMVVGQNSSGQLFFDTTPNARRIFIWKPYNAFDHPDDLLRKISGNYTR